MPVNSRQRHHSPKLINSKDMFDFLNIMSLVRERQGKKIVIKLPLSISEPNFEIS